MLKDRENILNALREKPLKAYSSCGVPIFRMRKPANPCF